MKLYRRDFKVYKDWIFILPTITVSLNDPQYRPKNISIEFHFLIFHARLLWMKGE